MCIIDAGSKTHQSPDIDQVGVHKKDRPDRADDIIGAGKGTQLGSGVRLEYRIKLPEHAGGHVLDVIDWMYLVDNGTIMNRSQFRKFGIKVAELVATMRPVEQSGERREAA